MTFAVADICYFLLQSKLQQEPSVIMGQTTANQRITQLEAEVTAKKAEIATLKEQVILAPVVDASAYARIQRSVCDKPGPLG